jgi:hypothetical protein
MLYPIVLETEDKDTLSAYVSRLPRPVGGLVLYALSLRLCGLRQRRAFSPSKALFSHTLDIRSSAKPHP